MTLEHDFIVALPVDRAWTAVTGAEAVAACLPAADLRFVHDVHTGRVELDRERGISCEARIVTIDRDEDEHVATVALSGRQVEGPGIGSVTLRSRLMPAGDGATKVSLSAELSTSGHDPDNGFIAAATRLLEELAQGLEQRATELPPPSASAPTAATAPLRAVPPPYSPAPSPAPARNPATVTIGAAAAAGALVTVAVLRRLRGRRRGRLR